jgi:hypothetical protein
MAGTNVPGLDNSPQISQNVPGVQFPMRGAAEAGQMIQHGGEGVQRLAAAGGEIYDEITRQHDITTATQQSTEASVQHSKMRQDLENSTPDGFVRDTTTGEVIQNRDGTQKTIAQQYWENADSDYQSRQNSMSPRAAAMFRQQMQRTITENTQFLQRKSLEMQRKNSEDQIMDVRSVFSKDFDRSFVPDNSAYYSAAGQDGSTKEYPSAQKFFDAAQTLQLLRQQQGPVAGKVGMYNPAEIDALKKGDSAELANNWLTSAKLDLIESNGSRSHLHDALKQGSTTALAQVYSLLDIVEGKDPESSRRNKSDLPTINGSLTPAQVEKWRTDLLGMIPSAKSVDRSDFDNHAHAMEEKAKTGAYSLSPDALFTSKDWNYLMHAAGPLGLTAEEQQSKLEPIFANALTASLGGASFDKMNAASQMAFLQKRGEDWSKSFEQHGAMAGMKYTGDQAKALVSHAMERAFTDLKQSQTEASGDYPKYLAGLASGAQDFSNKGGVKYRSATIFQGSQQITNDPSLFAVLKNGPGGKPLISTMGKEMEYATAQKFGKGADVQYFSKEIYQDYASRIKNAPGDQAEAFFTALKKADPKRAGIFLQQMVEYGGLNQGYQIAQGWPTAVQRAGVMDGIRADTLNPTPGEKIGDETKAQVWDKARKALGEDIKFNNGLLGAGSLEASTANNALGMLWVQKYKEARLMSMGEGSAADYANTEVRKGNPSTSYVGDTHHFLGMSFGTSGPQAQVKFTRADMTPDEQQSTKENLLKAQKAESLSRYQFVPAPVAPGDYNFNPKLQADWIAEHADRWVPVRQGTPDAAYRLYYRGTNADGSPGTKTYPVQIHGSDGTPSFYEVKEKDALKAMPGHVTAKPAAGLTDFDKQIQDQQRKQMGQ